MNIVLKRITDHTGFIIRTAAQGQKEAYILREVKILLNLWSKIKRYAKVKKAPSILWAELPIYTKIIRDFTTGDYKEIIVDDPNIYKEVKRYVGAFLP